MQRTALANACGCIGQRSALQSPTQRTAITNACGCIGQRSALRFMPHHSWTPTAELSAWSSRAVRWTQKHPASHTGRLGERLILPVPPAKGLHSLHSGRAGGGGFRASFPPSLALGERLILPMPAVKGLHSLPPGRAGSGGFLAGSGGFLAGGGGSLPAHLAPPLAVAKPRDDGVDEVQSGIEVYLLIYI